jgi:hypothetical protein
VQHEVPFVIRRTQGVEVVRLTGGERETTGWVPISPPKYGEFIAAVRRHRPSELLGVLAALSSHTTLDAFRPRRTNPTYPWVLAAAARESIAWGNEYRTAPVDDAAIARLSRLYTEGRDPYLREQGADGAFMSLFVRMSHEQFPYQHSLFEEMARVLPLLERRVDGAEVLTDAAVWRELLGVSLVDYIKIGTLLATAVWRNSGRFDPDWLGRPAFLDVLEEVPAEAILELFHGGFATSRAEATALARAGRHRTDELRRFDFNFLFTKPFVEHEGGVYLAPQGALVARKVSPSSLYHMGMQRWGTAFSRDLGRVYEAYVGEQLGQLTGSGCRVVPEIEYEQGKKTCDYFLVVGDICYCVEVKAARIAMPGRTDIRGYLDDVRRDVGKGIRQVARSADLVRAAHRSLPSEIVDREVRGLVVTAESHYLINSRPVREQLGGSDCPTTVVSVGELERLIEYALGEPGPDVFSTVTRPGTDPFDIRFSAEFKRVERAGVRKANPILEAGFERGYWESR